jgi:hypothetical protein
MVAKITCDLCKLMPIPFALSVQYSCKKHKSYNCKLLTLKIPYIVKRQLQNAGIDKFSKIVPVIWKTILYFLGNF